MKTVDVKIPSVGESIAQVTMGQWLKKSGEWVAMDSALCELESDKASVELSAPVSGILEIVAEAGSTQAIAAVVARIQEQPAPAAGQNAPAAPAPLPEVKTQQTATASNSNIASPAAAKMLRESPDLAGQVAASGKDGRVTKQDVLAAAAAGPVQPKLALVTPAANAGAVQSSSETASKAQRKPMTTMRKTIAKRLLAAKNQTAMLTTFNEVDMFQLMELRKKYKDQFKERHQVGLGFMSLFTKAVCVALERFTVVGAFIDGEDIVYPGHTSIGVAVSTEKGLMVPVVRQAGHLALWQIEKEIARLALKARDGKLSIDDMQGGVFTITNGGVFGSMLSTPILNAPQSAILGMHNIVERPWVVNGQIVIRPIMYLALSYDHRLIDGKDSVSFLKTVKELIEDPARLLLEV